MNHPDSPPSEDALREGLHKATALAALLDDEYALLNSGDLDSFEALQLKKNETLEALSSLLPALVGNQDTVEPDNESPAALIQEIICIYPRLSPPQTLTNAMSNRVFYFFDGRPEQPGFLFF